MTSTSLAPALQACASGTYITEAAAEAATRTLTAPPTPQETR
jgi:hypothetical protein